MNARNTKKGSKSTKTNERTDNAFNASRNNHSRNDRLRQSNRGTISGCESGNTDNADRGVGRNIPKYNDPAWYNNDGLLDLAGRLSFADALGESLNLTTPDFTGWEKGSMPGVMTLEVLPSVGISTDNRSAVNIAAQEMYNKVRSVQTSAAKYGKQDLMMYYLAVQNAHNLYWIGVRALGMTNFINRMNRYTPLQMSDPLGFNLTDISKQTARFANILNFYAKQLASYAIPANFDFAKRQRYMFSNIFSESTAAKSKFYVIKPDGYFKFVLNSSTNYGELVYTELPNKALTVDNFSDILDSVLASFVGDEDFGTMSGDILKTFPNSLVGWTPIDNDFTLTPVFDEVTLASIHNAVVLEGSGFKDNKITQDPGINKDYLIYNPKIVVPTNYKAYENKKDPILGKRLLDIGGLPATPEMIAESTRLMNIPVLDQVGTDPCYRLDRESSLEIPVNAKIYKFGANGNIEEYQMSFASEIKSTGNQFVWADIRNAVSIAALATEFKYSPQKYITALTYAEGGTFDSADINLLTPIENYAVVTPEFLRDLHKVCTLSLFSTKNL